MDTAEHEGVGHDGAWPSTIETETEVFARFCKHTDPESRGQSVTSFTNVCERETGRGRERQDKERDRDHVSLHHVFYTCTLTVRTD